MINWLLYLLSFLFIYAGIMHFVRPKFFESILPHYLPIPKQLVYISGVTEIIAGILLLFPTTRSIGAIGIIIMLVLFMPVHIYMVTPRYKTNVSRWLLWARIPLQFLLIFWAYQYI